jgi:hypothetical protein
VEVRLGHKPPCPGGMGSGLWKKRGMAEVVHTVKLA